MRRLRTAAAFLCALAVLVPASAASEFDGVSLEDLNGRRTDLSRCPEKRCLTIYVSPWCGYCKQAMPLFRELRGRLEPRGVATRIIVGMDGREELVNTARQYGPDTLLDPGNRIRVNGVPNLILSDEDGQVLKRHPGAPSSTESAMAWVLGGDAGAQAPVEPERGPVEPPADKPPGPMSLEDARVNFETMVQTYLAQREKEGVLSVRDPGTGGRRLLKFLAVESGSVAKIKDGLYEGRVVFTDVSSGLRVFARFGVDFSDEHWRVVSARVLPSAPARVSKKSRQGLR